MPDFTFSTVLMALLASNILAGLTALLFLHGKTMARVGYQVLTLLVCLTVFRLLVPLELPFSQNIYMPQLFSRAVSFFRMKWIPFLTVRLSLWNVFELLWAAGIVVHLALYIHDYRRTRDYILKYGQDKTDNPDYQAALDAICRQHGRKNRFHVIELPDLNIPLLFGIRTPCILLPDRLTLTPGQRYYVLSHEAMHYFHHDFLIKEAMRLLSVFYWWNPACALLYRQTNTLLEMHIDKKITRGKPELKEEYAECLLAIRKNALSPASSTPRFIIRNGCFFVQSKETDLKRRMIMLLHDSDIWHKLRAGISMALSVAGIYLLSYCFILEANYLPPEIEQNYTVPTKDNTYAVKLDSSGYEIYINGSYWGTAASLEYYPEGIIIYNQEGDVIDEN